MHTFHLICQRIEMKEIHSESVFFSSFSHFYQKLFAAFMETGCLLQSFDFNWKFPPFFAIFSLVIFVILLCGDIWPKVYFPFVRYSKKKKLLHQSFGAFDKFAGGKNVQDMNSIWINCGQNGKKTRKREMQYQTLVSTFLTIQNLNINRKFGKDQTKREWKKNQDSALSKLKWEPSMN